MHIALCKLIHEVIITHSRMASSHDTALHSHWTECHARCAMQQFEDEAAALEEDATQDQHDQQDGQEQDQQQDPGPGGTPQVPPSLPAS